MEQVSPAQNSWTSECGSEAGDSGEEGSALQQAYAALSRKEQPVTPANMHSSVGTLAPAPTPPPTLPANHGTFWARALDAWLIRAPRLERFKLHA